MWSQGSLLVVACFEAPLELEEHGADFHKFFDMFPVEAAVCRLNSLRPRCVDLGPRDVQASTKHDEHLVADGMTRQDKVTEPESCTRFLVSADFRVLCGKAGTCRGVQQGT